MMRAEIADEMMEEGESGEIWIPVEFNNVILSYSFYSSCVDSFLILVHSIHAWSLTIPDYEACIVHCVDCAVVSIWDRLSRIR